MQGFWLTAGLGLLGFLGYRAGRVWVDARRRGMEPVHRLRWVLAGTISPSRYWWGARLDAMPLQERADLLHRETHALDLSQPDSLRCPICRAEVPRAWRLAAGGRPVVAPGPVRCPRCDFRLDACRHCARFLPGSAQDWTAGPWRTGDLASGRCSHYKASQPVEQACAPGMARRLRARGYDQIRAPLAIVDSFLPPDSCRAFTPDRRRLREGGIRWPDARHTALLRLLAYPAAVENPREVTGTSA